MGERTILGEISPRKVNYGARFRDVMSGEEFMTLCLCAGMQRQDMVDSYGGHTRLAVVQLTGPQRGLTKFFSMDTVIEILQAG